MRPPGRLYSEVCSNLEQQHQKTEQTAWLRKIAEAIKSGARAIVVDQLPETEAREVTVSELDARTTSRGLVS